MLGGPEQGDERMTISFSLSPGKAVNDELEDRVARGEVVPTKRPSNRTFLVVRRFARSELRQRRSSCFNATEPSIGEHHEPRRWNPEKH